MNKRIADALGGDAKARAQLIQLASKAATSSWTCSWVPARPLIAAVKTGCRCRGLELDPLSVDVIVRRYHEVTGHHGILRKTGEAFTEVAARRLQEIDERNYGF